LLLKAGKVIDVFAKISPVDSRYVRRAIKRRIRDAIEFVTGRQVSHRCSGHVYSSMDATEKITRGAKGENHAEHPTAVSRQNQVAYMFVTYGETRKSIFTDNFKVSCGKCMRQQD
jgi:hypothetical protein